MFHGQNSINDGDGEKSPFISDIPKYFGWLNRHESPLKQMVKVITIDHHVYIGRILRQESTVDLHMEVSTNGGTPIAGWFMKGKPQSKTDDNWGYPHLWIELVDIYIYIYHVPITIKITIDHHRSP